MDSACALSAGRTQSYCLFYQCNSATLKRSANVDGTDFQSGFVGLYTDAKPLDKCKYAAAVMGTVER